MADFENIDPPTMISQKICVSEKILKFPLCDVHNRYIQISEQSILPQTIVPL